MVADFELGQSDEPTHRVAQIGCRLVVAPVNTESRLNRTIYTSGRREPGDRRDLAGNPFWQAYLAAEQIEAADGPHVGLLNAGDLLHHLRVAPQRLPAHGAIDRTPNARR